MFRYIYDDVIGGLLANEQNVCKKRTHNQSGTDFVNILTH